MRLFLRCPWNSRVHLQIVLSSATAFPKIWSLKHTWVQDWLIWWFSSESLYFLSRVVSATLCCCLADRGGFWSLYVFHCYDFGVCMCFIATIDILLEYKTRRDGFSRYWGLKNGEKTSYWFFGLSQFIWWNSSSGIPNILFSFLCASSLGEVGFLAQDFYGKNFVSGTWLGLLVSYFLHEAIFISLGRVSLFVLICASDLRSNYVLVCSQIMPWSEKLRSGNLLASVVFIWSGPRETELSLFEWGSFSFKGSRIESELEISKLSSLLCPPGKTIFFYDYCSSW